MGHFTIDFANYQKVDVRWGKVRKLRVPFFRRRKPHELTVARGYIVTIGENKETQKIYRLFKFQTGEWFTDPDGIGKLDTEELLQIKDAILRKEVSGV
ncbi:MAG: hypothetical protein C5B59_11690 [Bacteroidetes bacterium]|nr:MAG: hypothetical protein C5B59_11690 [Bacteroidota bacterium]